MLDAEYTKVDDLKEVGLTKLVDLLYSLDQVQAYKECGVYLIGIPMTTQPHQKKKC